MLAQLLTSNVGTLVNLWLLWRSSDLAISNIRSGSGERLVFGIGYALLALLLLLVLIGVR